MENIEIVEPLKGAALYVVSQSIMGHTIVMYPSDGSAPSVIDSCIKKYDSAVKRRNRWQKKENAAILKSNR